MSQYNPYAAPQAAPLVPTGPMPGGGSGPQPWEIGEVLGHAWNVFKPNWATLVFSQLLAGILGSIPNYIPTLLVAVHQLEENTTEYWIVYGVCLVAGLLLVNTFFQVGLTRICLAAARQQSPQFGDLFNGLGRYLPLLAASTLTFLVAFVGYLFFVVPGVILLLGLSLTSYYVVDQNMGPIEAMKASWAATTGHKGNLFLFGLLGGLMFIGGCAACYFGIFVAMAVMMVASSTIYLRLSGMWGAGTSVAYGPPGYGPPAGGGGYEPPGGGGFGPPPGGGGFGPPPGGGGYGPPPGGGGGFGPPPGGGGYGPA